MDIDVELCLLRILEALMSWDGTTLIPTFLQLIQEVQFELFPKDVMYSTNLKLYVHDQTTNVKIVF